MRQKVRAAELALHGSADVAITGPHTMADTSSWTRFWRTQGPDADLTLLTRAVGVPSVSGDERELAALLRDWCAERGIDATVDEGRQTGRPPGAPAPRRGLLLLGHLDTVPHRWPVEWRGEELWGRGSVDAKGCLVNFLQVLADAEVPADGQLRVVGAVEEEISSSKGAFHARDHYPADAVVIGEPSGSGTLTLGYFGLFKLRVTVSVASGGFGGHGRGHRARRAGAGPGGHPGRGPAGGVRRAQRRHRHQLPHRPRTPPGRRHPQLPGAARCRPGAAAQAGARPGRYPGADRGAARHQDTRAAVQPLAKVFARAFAQAGIRPRHVVKKGTSDMNTLATTWQGVPMVAYGPGRLRARPHRHRTHRRR
ncbi:N-acetyl-ornithine/N-acetyl-lysine deacetylase OS=Streptomyces glaucescens OX=1907 GN=SGLAU_17290 PE=4 SV=1 [Streptomyces glaucescens]